MVTPGSKTSNRTSRPSADGLCDHCLALVRNPDTADFPSTLSGYMAKYHVPANEVERITGLDHAYVSRLMRGDKCSPSRDIVAQVVFALARHGLEFGEADDLYRAAGYRSPYRRRYRDDPGQAAGLRWRQ